MELRQDPNEEEEEKKYCDLNIKGRFPLDLKRALYSEAALRGIWPYEYIISILINRPLEKKE